MRSSAKRCRNLSRFVISRLGGFVDEGHPHHGSLDGSKRSAAAAKLRPAATAGRGARTSIPAKSMSVPQVNSMITSDWPEAGETSLERTFAPRPPLLRQGEIRFSISVGAAPGTQYGS
jgi:hypothetical protein